MLSNVPAFTNPSSCCLFKNHTSLMFFSFGSKSSMVKKNFVGNLQSEWIHLWKSLHMNTDIYSDLSQEVICEGPNHYMLLIESGFILIDSYSLYQKLHIAYENSVCTCTWCYNWDFCMSLGKRWTLGGHNKSLWLAIVVLKKTHNDTDSYMT